MAKLSLKKLVRGAIANQPLTIIGRTISGGSVIQKEDQSIKESIKQGVIGGLATGAVVVTGGLASGAIAPSVGKTLVAGKPNVVNMQKSGAVKNFLQNAGQKGKQLVKEKVKNIKGGIVNSSPSGSIQFGKESNQAWLPFAIIGGIVLILIIRPFGGLFASGRKRRR